MSAMGPVIRGAIIAVCLAMNALGFRRPFLETEGCGVHAFMT
jgi:hypothetical protein